MKTFLILSTTLRSLMGFSKELSPAIRFGPEVGNYPVFFLSYISLMNAGYPILPILFIIIIVIFWRNVYVRLLLKEQLKTIHLLIRCLYIKPFCSALEREVYSGGLN